MTTSFDAKLEAIHKRRLFRVRENDIWPEGTKEFNQKLAVAEDLLHVFWKTSQLDTNFTEACIKSSLITNLRTCFDEMARHVNNTIDKDKSFLGDHASYCSKIMRSFVKVQNLFQFTETMAAYKLLFDCLCPTKIESLGEGSEIFHNVKYHKLLEITSLFGFTLNSNVSIGSITQATRTSFSKDVANILDGIIKPYNLSGFELINNEALPYTRIKFIQEDKVDIMEAHPDFLKVVAIMRLFHSSIIYNMKPSTENADTINSLVTYGLLTEKKFVRVLGMRVTVPVVQHKKKNYTYHLYNVGTFPIEPTTEQERLELDKLVAFLLEVCRYTVYEENKQIKNISKLSVGRKQLNSMTSNNSDFLIGDQLVIETAINGSTKLGTTVTLKEYLMEWSTFENEERNRKDIFQGVIDHSCQPVFVKICYGEKQKPIPSNIFLPIGKVYHKDVLCSHNIEISLQGEDFSVTKRRIPLEKMYIFSQLLLEIEKIHINMIHNDVKPSNIILIGETDEKQFHCKLIDFEMSCYFQKEDGDVCQYLGSVCTSTAGTPNYNAPEKQENEDNYIHPKTDIYSLALVFIELILEREINQTELHNGNDFWIHFEKECERQFTENGKLLVEMIQKMVCKSRKQRITATECLKLLGVSEKVDSTDYTRVFFPNSASLESSIGPPGNSSSEIEMTSQETDFTPFITSQKSKPCCKCITGACIGCNCKDKAVCLNCKSKNCSKKRKKDEARIARKKKKISK